MSGYEKTTGHLINCLSMASGASDPDCPACLDAAVPPAADRVDEFEKLVRWHREDGMSLAEMRTTIERLRAELKQQPDRADVLREAASHLDTLDPVEAALAGQHAWKDAAAELRRMADETPRDGMTGDGTDD